MIIGGKREKSLVMAGLPRLARHRARRAAEPRLQLEDAPDLKGRESGPGKGVDGRAEPGRDGCERAARARPMRAPIRAPEKSP
jgi:hypothetical protein